MNFQLPFSPAGWKEQIDHRDPILLTGSCFSENIGDKLADLKFNVLQNPNGIIYDPISITNSFLAAIDKVLVKEDELAESGGLWHSWDHHGSFSGTDRAEVTARINDSVLQSHLFLSSAKWVFITLGSAFHYTIAENGRDVANCHKFPANTFKKNLLTIEAIKSSLDTCIHRLFHFNRDLKIIFTVSPVRYIRDGLVENNLSKARLIEVVQHLVSKFTGIYYFPAYEIVNDVLRDYRFFKEDLVHPSAQAVDYVFEQFATGCFTKPTLDLTAEIAALNTAIAHRPLHPDSEPHKKFSEELKRRVAAFEEKHSWIKF
ncbi:MAG: GSCFA domain-containing protein [Chitinophagaceae bacterium]|nr:MAG: GSCFA domain-containing protein [Chitinophagaceae bacterium]